MAARAVSGVGPAASGLHHTAAWGSWSAVQPSAECRLVAPHCKAESHKPSCSINRLNNLTLRLHQSFGPYFCRGWPAEVRLWHTHQSRKSGPAQERWRQAAVRSMAVAGVPANERKVVVVTGVSKGLGQSLALELASRGHTVVGCARSEASVKEMADRLGDPHSFSVVDVASDKEVRSWADATVERFGVPDIVVNNAGLINKNAPLWEVPVEEFDAVIDVNLKGPANVIRHFVPHMVAKQRGVVVNMSSGWGRSAAPDVAPYCTTKWGIEGMSRSLARELPRGCVAVALNPGVINTDMLQSCFGPSASMYQTADTWSRDAADLILSINANDNGSSMTVT